MNDNEEMTLSSIESRHSPKHYTRQNANTLQSKKCETNDDRPKDEVNITLVNVIDIEVQTAHLLDSQGKVENIVMQAQVD